MIHHGDLFDVLPTMEESSIDACVTDPPYGIGFMGKEWDTFKPGVAETRIVVNTQIDSDNPNLKGRTRGPASSPSAVEYDYSVKGLRGFQEWTEKWAREVFRVVKPGAHVLVCGAPRSYHRMASGLEDAGFEIRDCISWNFGQGFPKSLNFPDGWGTALKPAWESVTVAQKPFSVPQEQRIIIANLLKLEAQLWAILPANVAESRFGLSPRAHAAACGSARWPADVRSSTWADLCGETDTSRCVSAIDTSLNIVSSWNDILAAAFARPSMFTTETRTSQTIDWKTLRSCSSVLMPQDIIRAELSAPGSRFDALPVARYLNVALLNISAILELSVLAPAISSALATCQDETDLVLTPDIEFFALARKPFKGSVEANRAKWGTGAINVDGCRIVGEWTGSSTRQAQEFGAGKFHAANGQPRADIQQEQNDLGRWPANVALDEAAAAMLDAQSGELTSGEIDFSRHTDTSSRQTYGGFPNGDKRTGSFGGNSGGASRFYYVAKPSRTERDQGCEFLEPKQRDDSRKEGNPGGDNPRNRGLQKRGNHHPTVKPVELMRYLVRLVTPPGGVVLDPFTGSGTTGMACAYEGFRFIGVEREAEYVAIAERRIASCVPLFSGVSA